MSQPQILVVDNEYFQLELLERGLRKAGFIVYTASGGRDALELFAATTIDLVLLDLTMPDMNGFEVCSALRKISNVPIMMMAATDNREDIEQSYGLGVNDYIVKPFQLHEAIERIEAYLSTSEKQSINTTKAPYS